MTCSVPAPGQGWGHGGGSGRPFVFEELAPFRRERWQPKEGSPGQRDELCTTRARAVGLQAGNENIGARSKCQGSAPRKRQAGLHERVCRGTARGEKGAVGGGGVTGHGTGKRRGVTRSGLASRKPLARASGNFPHSKDALMFGGRERSGIAELKSRFHAKKSSVDTAAINSWNGG